MKRIYTIIGARPQFIKASAFSMAVNNSNQLQEVIINTDQHYDANMAKVFFDELKINEPKYNLHVGSGSHGQQTAKMLVSIEEILVSDKPDFVLVYGDTNSTLAGALASAKLKIPVIHIEAGLRSFNRNMPEELNRIMTDHISTILFAPTETAVHHLEREGISGDAVHNVGDVMYDVSKIARKNISRHKSSLLDDIGVNEGNYILATIHRAENTDSQERLNNIFSAFAEISRKISVVLPIHPRTLHKMENSGLLSNIPSNCKIIDPLGFFDMARLMESSAVIATDSGGLQKEAFFFRRPCVTLREETEWVELVELGWNKLANTSSKDEIVSSVLSALGSVGHESAPYGDGTAAEKIVKVIENYS
jgi:UDP-GlcNAc3NAcA epimerase